MGRPARRGLSSCALALAATTGCAQLAGIDETSGLVPPERVSLQVDRVSLGATVMRTPENLIANPASFLVTDDSPEGFARIEAELTQPDLWTAEIPTGTPPVQFSFPEVGVQAQRLYQFPTRNLRVQHAIYEHRSPQPAPPNAMLTVDMTLPTPYVTGQTFQFSSVGTWNGRAFPAAELPVVDMGALAFGPSTFAFSATSKLPGREHEKITTADAVLILRYTANRLSGVLEAAPFDQDGTDTIMGAMTAIPADAMLAVNHQPMTVAARYSPLRPAMSVPNMSWLVLAAPGVDEGATRGVSLHSAAVLAADPPLMVAYGNPFVAKGWRSVFLFATSATRTVTPDGQLLPVTLRAELFTYTEPTAGMTMTLPAGLPELITINGMPLSTDNLTIPRPVAPVMVSFIANGSATIHSVQLFELVPNAADTALEYRPVMEAVGLTKELMLPADMFVPGKRYTVRAASFFGGFPNAADGDLSRRTFPLSVGYHDSGVFTVAP